MNPNSSAGNAPSTNDMNDHNQDEAQGQDL
jgi:hypothetical protein